MIAGVILAGGRASRMGGIDKVMLQLGNAPILGHVIARLRPQVARLAINANGDPNRFAAFGLPVVADGLPEGVPPFPGPLGGLLAALDWGAAEGAEAVVTAAGDTPFFPQCLVEGLCHAAVAAGHAGAIAFTEAGDGRLDRHPTFGLWPVSRRDELRAALAAGLRRVMDFAETGGAATAVFRDSPDPFFNINTPQDLEQARARIAA